MGRNAKPLGPKYKAPAAGARVKTKAKGPKPQRAMRSVSRGAKVNTQGPRATKPIRAPSPQASHYLQEKAHSSQSTHPPKAREREAERSGGLHSARPDRDRWACRTHIRIRSIRREKAEIWREHGGGR